MTLQQYLQRRRRYEAIVIGIVLLLIGTTNATTIILENYRNGEDPNWLGAFATEFTAVIVVPVLLPLLYRFVDWLNLNLGNLRWRVLWHVPGFVIYSLLHVGLFVFLRKLLWPLAGYQYEFGPFLLSMVYEMRKMFWAYLLIMIIIYTYRFVLDRLQGEARFLHDADDAPATASYRDQFLVKMLDREYLVRVDQIDWVQSASNYVLLHCGTRQYPMRQTLKNLLAQLDPQRFHRVHRTAVVNLDKIISIQDKGDMCVRLVSGITVPVSKTHIRTLRLALEDKTAHA